MLVQELTMNELPNVLCRSLFVFFGGLELLAAVVIFADSKYSYAKTGCYY